MILRYFFFPYTICRKKKKNMHVTTVKVLYDLEGGGCIRACSLLFSLPWRVLAVCGGKAAHVHHVDRAPTLLRPEALSQVLVGAELPMLLVPVGHFDHPQDFPNGVGEERSDDQHAGQRDEGQPQDMRGDLHVLHQRVEALSGLEGVVQDHHGHACRHQESAEGGSGHAEFRLGKPAPSRFLLQAAGDDVLGVECTTIAGPVHSSKWASRSFQLS